MNTKQCKKCKEVKCLTEFHSDKSKKGGLRHECKICSIHRVRAYRESEHGAGIVKRYNKSASRKAAQNKYEETEAGKLVSLEYRRSEKGRNTGLRHKRSDAFKKWYAEYKKSNKDKLSARNAVSWAVKTGKIPVVRSLSCSNCGKRADGYHHHLGYSKQHRLDVIPLCFQCHSDSEK